MCIHFSGEVLNKQKKYGFSIINVCGNTSENVHAKEAQMKEK